MTEQPNSPNDLFEAHGSWAGRFALLEISDPIDAEDLLYETFVRAARDDVHHGRDFFLALAAALRRAGRRSFAGGYEPIPESEGPSPSSAPAAIWRDLAHRERHALFLTHGTPFDEKEAAAIFGGTVSALRRNAERALESLGGDRGAEHGGLLFERLGRQAFPARRFRLLQRRLRDESPDHGPVFRYDSFDTPVGRLRIGVVDGLVVDVGLGSESDEAWLGACIPRCAPRAEADPKALRPVRQQFEEYFRGKRREFQLPYHLLGTTPFQADVLGACAEVPYGTVSSYKALARKVGNPKATRAVGGALGGNPLPILIPCHRILSSAGKLHGFSGGGLANKEKLLALEGRANLFAPIAID